METGIWRINRFECLQSVCDVAPAGTTILLPEGDFHQKLIIRTPGLSLIGAGADRTRIIFGDHARMSDSVNRPLGTFRSYTLAIIAPGVSIQDLSVINNAGDPSEKGQQVALSVYGDGFFMRHCSVRSTQDTVFLGPLPPDLIIRYREILPPELRAGEPVRSLFESCLIEGSVDFLFGGGEAKFLNCTIRSVADGRSIGYVAAPSHSRSQSAGFLFDHCRFTSDGIVPPQSVFLARPWRSFGIAFFLGCEYGNHINASGFDPWGTSGRSATARFYEYPLDSRRVKWAREGSASSEISI